MTTNLDDPATVSGEPCYRAPAFVDGNLGRKNESNLNVV